MSKIFFLSNIFQNNIDNTQNIFKRQYYEEGYDIITNKMKINKPKIILWEQIYFLLIQISAKWHKLNNKQELVHIRTYQEKDKFSKKTIKSKIELLVPTVDELNEK